MHHAKFESDAEDDTRSEDSSDTSMSAHTSSDDDSDPPPPPDPAASRERANTDYNPPVEEQRQQWLEMPIEEELEDGVMAPPTNWQLAKEHRQQWLDMSGEEELEHADAPQQEDDDMGASRPVMAPPENNQSTEEHRQQWLDMSSEEEREHADAPQKARAEELENADAPEQPENDDKGAKLSYDHQKLRSAPRRAPEDLCLVDTSCSMQCTRCLDIFVIQSANGATRLHVLQSAASGACYP